MAEEDPSPGIIAFTIVTIALVFGVCVYALWLHDMLIGAAIFVSLFSAAVYLIRRQIIKARNADELADHQA